MTHRTCYEDDVISQRLERQVLNVLRIFQVRLRVTFLSVNELWELCRITNEEHGRVIRNY